MNVVDGARDRYGNERLLEVPRELVTWWLPWNSCCRLAVPLRKRDVIALFTFVIAVAALPVITSLTNLRIVFRHDISAILYSIIKIKYFQIIKYQIK
jgi:hypothetical protein